MKQAKWKKTRNPNKYNAYPFVVVFDLSSHADLHNKRRVFLTVLCQDKISIFARQVLRRSHEKHVSTSWCLSLLLSHLFQGHINTYIQCTTRVIEIENTELLVLSRAPPWPSSLCVWEGAEQHGDPVELKLRMSTSLDWIDGTGEASWVPCEWGRRAASALGLG